VANSAVIVVGVVADEEVVDSSDEVVVTDPTSLAHAVTTRAPTRSALT
jgi:hypothetical protein